MEKLQLQLRKLKIKAWNCKNTAQRCALYHQQGVLKEKIEREKVLQRKAYEAESLPFKPRKYEQDDLIDSYGSSLVSLLTDKELQEIKQEFGDQYSNILTKFKEEPKMKKETTTNKPQTTVIFSKPELNDRVVKVLEAVIEKFKSKNASYGAQEDGFYNFRYSAKRMPHILGANVLEAQFNDALVLFDKHWGTLIKNGINDPECEDRLGDMIAYGALMMAMKQQQKETEEMQKCREVQESPIDLHEMNWEEAKEALRQGKCTKIQCKQWWLATDPFIYLKGSKFLYKQNDGFSEKVIEGVKIGTDSSESIWYAID